MKTKEDLIKGCINSNRADQKAFYTYYYPRLMAISLRMSPDKETASDLIQDSFVKIFSSLKNIKGYDEAVVFTWCKSITTNTIIDYLRKPTNKLKLIELDSTDDDGREKYNIQVEAKDYDTTLLNYKNLEPSDVMEAIESLPKSYKVVFNLIIDGYTHKEIASKLNIVEGTSKSNYHKARVNLMNKLDAICEEEEYKLFFELN